jgi:drug/metabolite transporter (DMT)-like permease
MTWLWYAWITTFAWGVWGALMEFPDKNGFPSTLSYVVWALTMVPCALVALSQVKWKFERSGTAIIQGALVGFLGAGGQLVLFEALRHGPAYIVFPIVSLYPVLTVLMSTTLIGEKASRRQWLGVIIALPAIGLLSYAPPAPPSKPPASATASANPTVSAPLQEPGIAPGVQGNATSGFGGEWLLLAIGVFVAWGIQAFFMKTATKVMSSEGLFVYMALTGLLLAPIAFAMTELKTPIEWNPMAGWKSPWVVAAIQILNAIGALTLVHAMRTGKAMIVAPLTSLAPLITILLSLWLHDKVPSAPQILGMAMAMMAIYFLAE